MKKRLLIPTLFTTAFMPLIGLSGCKGDNEKVTVTLNLNNCEPNKTITIDKGSTLKVEEPFKDRCNFLCWNLDGEEFDVSQPINQDLKLDAHYEYDSETIFENKSNPEVRYDDTNLRVMSYNLLVRIYNNKPHHHGYQPINDPYAEGINDGRDFQARDTIMRYLPDVIGLQECDQTSDFGDETDNGWYDFFDTIYNPTTFPYKIINDDNRTGKSRKDEDVTIFSTLMYNANTVEPEEDTFQTTLSHFSDNDNCRWLTCCVFHLKNDSSKRFIVTSTHWDLKESDRVFQARESANLTNYYVRNHDNLPVIATGDYNELDGDEAYQIFDEVSGLKESKYVAKARGLCTYTYHLGDGTGDKSDTTESSVNHWWYRDESTLLKRQDRADRVDCYDHLYISPDIICNYYDAITERRALYSSDHMPSYIDVTI